MLIDYLLIKYEIWHGFVNHVHMSIGIVLTFLLLIGLWVNFSEVDLRPKNKIDLWVAIGVYLVAFTFIWLLDIYLVIGLVIGYIIYLIYRLLKWYKTLPLK